jgi:membrane associated rhomboid family serine protease
MAEFLSMTYETELNVKQKDSFLFTPGVLGYPLGFVLLIWIVFWAEVRFGYDFTPYGIYPRTVEGLQGILISPFVHSDIEHLFHNTIPLFGKYCYLGCFYQVRSPG